MADSNESEGTSVANDQKTEDDCNESKSTSVASIQKTDDELNSLLDSALGDFAELSKEKPVEPKTEAPTAAREEEPDKMWSEMIKQALQIDPNIRDMFQQGSSDQKKFVEDFTKIAEAAAKVMEGETPTSFTDIMTETLKNLNESSETIQNQFGNPEEAANLFQEFGLNNGGAGQDAGSSFEDIPPFMQSIMQSFMSKEILYPSIKDFVDRYPQWLEEHKSSLSPQLYENYCKQLELMRKVVEEFEAERESDSDEVKKQRFQRIMGYMQQMQFLGQPPADLISSDSALDDLAMPPLPPGIDPSQCCVM